MSWNPIETMPTDGTHVLACDSKGRMQVVNKPVGYALGNWTKRPRQKPPNWFGSAASFFTPTHWMALPKRPR